jgi:hypothetical protein
MPLGGREFSRDFSENGKYPARKSPKIVIFYRVFRLYREIPVCTLTKFLSHDDQKPPILLGF